MTEDKFNIKTTLDAVKSQVPINQLNIVPPRRMKATNLFACAGVCEYYMADIGVDVILASELEPTRAKLHHGIYPDCTMIIGDIRSSVVQEQLAKIANREKVEILMASPKCQQITKANNNKNPNSPELFLFEEVLRHLDHCPSYKYVVIENAEEYMNFRINGLEKAVGAHIIDELKKRGFKYCDIGIQNAKHFRTAVNRDRTIIIGSKEKSVKLPKATSVTPIMLVDVIDDLPTLESGQKGPHWADVTDYVSSAQAKQIQVTPTGMRVEKPLRLSGEESKAMHKGAFCRAVWYGTMHSLMTNNGQLSAYHMIHPGRLLVDVNGKPVLNEYGQKQFTDCRTFTPHEIFRALRLPDDIQVPVWARYDMSLIRTCLGECWAPLHAQAVVAEFVRAEFNL